jgi:hypothetical protein
MGYLRFHVAARLRNGFTLPYSALWPEVYGLANLGRIPAITAAAVFATAVGPGVTGAADRCRHCFDDADALARRLVPYSQLFARICRAKRARP